MVAMLRPDPTFDPTLMMQFSRAAKFYPGMKALAKGHIFSVISPLGAWDPVNDVNNPHSTIYKRLQVLIGETFKRLWWQKTVREYQRLKQAVWKRRMRIMSLYMAGKHQSSHAHQQQLEKLNLDLDRLEQRLMKIEAKMAENYAEMLHLANAIQVRTDKFYDDMQAQQAQDDASLQQVFDGLSIDALRAHPDCTEDFTARVASGEVAENLSERLAAAPKPKRVQKVVESSMIEYLNRPHVDEDDLTAQGFTAVRDILGEPKQILNNRCPRAQQVHLHLMRDVMIISCVGGVGNYKVLMATQKAMQTYQQQRNKAALCTIAKHAKDFHQLVDKLEGVQTLCQDLASEVRTLRNEMTRIDGALHALEQGAPSQGQHFSAKN